jgi:hypothetical protein
MRVRWNDIPVRRAASSVEMSPDPDVDVTRRRSGWPAIRPHWYSRPLRRSLRAALVLQRA